MRRVDSRSATAALVAVAAAAVVCAQSAVPWTGVLDEHPAIQYATRPTTDRVAILNDALARGRSLVREATGGYLRAVLESLDVPPESQLLVFSKTGVQRAYTSPQTPRALYFNESVLVGYIPGAPVIEVAAQDPQQGIIFYTLDQAAPRPAFRRQSGCLTCHASASTLEVPGVLARSHTVGPDGSLLPDTGALDVDQTTPHPDRWGGWFVTASGGGTRYSQRAHAGNLTYASPGISSTEAFVAWTDSSPERLGYLSNASDIVSLLVFDHQVRAMNLLTRLNWESRVAKYDGRAAAADPAVRRLIDELAGYLTFEREAPPLAALTPRPEFGRHLIASVPRDARGRSLAQLDATTRLFAYPCSYMVYSAAFDALTPAVKEAVYRRVLERLGRRPGGAEAIAILSATKADFRTVANLAP